MGIMTLEEYYKRLIEADWFYHYSDDMRAYTAGDSEMKFLIKTAMDGGSEYVRMFNVMAKQRKFSTIGGDGCE